MKMRKILTAAAAALVLTTSGVLAEPVVFECTDGNGNIDPATIASGLQEMAGKLRCDSELEPNPEMWPWDNPIWQKRGSEVYGCEVHASLADKLYEERTFEDPDCDVRPRKNCSDRPPSNGNNSIQGASGDVTNGKYDAAISKLDSFINDANKARINEEFENIGGYNASFWKGVFTTKASQARGCIEQLL